MTTTTRRPAVRLTSRLRCPRRALSPFRTSSRTPGVVVVLLLRWPRLGFHRWGCLRGRRRRTGSQMFHPRRQWHGSISRHRRLGLRVVFLEYDSPSVRGGARVRRGAWERQSMREPYDAPFELVCPGSASFSSSRALQTNCLRWCRCASVGRCSGQTWSNS